MIRNHEINEIAEKGKKITNLHVQEIKQKKIDKLQELYNVTVEKLAVTERKLLEQSKAEVKKRNVLGNENNCLLREINVKQKAFTCLQDALAKCQQSFKEKKGP